MERTLLYAAAGCFIGTLAALYLGQFRSNPFLLFLVPMWGMVLAVSIAKVVDLRNPSIEDPKEQKV